MWEIPVIKTISALLGVLCYMSLTVIVPLVQRFPENNSSEIPLSKSLQNYRLPRYVIPYKYELQIRPIVDDVPDDQENWRSPGEVTILVTCLEETKEILLHSDNIAIQHSEVEIVNTNDDSEIRISEHILEHPDFYKIILDQPLVPNNNYSIYIPFFTHISNATFQSSGIFRAEYLDEEANETRFMVTTQFQPIFARKAFPCFDDPDFKSVFEISIGRLEKYHSLSNMDIRETTKDPELDGWAWDHFNPTPKMSTYLVCFVVSEFDSETADPALSSGTIVKVWAPKVVIENHGVKYSAKLAAEMITFFEDYFGIPYELPKLDLVLVPQFSSTAMENWGLITFKEDKLIYNPLEHTIIRKFLVVLAVTHEIAHQWIGNLVTCKWWSDIWLNEGFATYLTKMAIETKNMNFLADLWFVNVGAQRTLMTDKQRLGAKAIRHSMETQSQIFDGFTSLTYYKGAALISMMEHFLTKPRLQVGIQNFLKNMAYEGAEQDDIFKELSLVGRDILPKDVSVKEIMSSWTTQQGFPLVRVFSRGNNTIELTQEKFTLTPLDRQLISKEYWWIPVNIITRTNPVITRTTPETWIPANTSKILFSSSSIDTSGYIVINPNCSGYYRVLYDTHFTRLIQEQLLLDHLVFDAVTRSKLIDDYFYLATAEYIPFEAALEMTKYLGKEKDFIVWHTAIHHLTNMINLFLSFPEKYELLKDYLLPKIEAVLISVGVEQTLKDPDNIVYLRTSLLEVACEMKSSLCFNYAFKLFQQWTTSPLNNPVPVEIERVIYCAMIVYLGRNALTFIIQRTVTETVESRTRSNLLEALGCSSDRDILALSIRMVHHTPAIAQLISNKSGRDLAIDYVYRNFTQIDTLNFSKIVKTLSGYWFQVEDIQKFQEFVNEKADVFLTLSVSKVAFNEFMLTVNSGIERMKENHLWMLSYGKACETWLKKQIKDD